MSLPSSAAAARSTLSSSPVLRFYRELLELIRHVPEAQRSGAMAEARSKVQPDCQDPPSKHDAASARVLTAMREGATVADPIAAEERYKELVARVSYLRMTVPKHLLRKTSTSQTGTFVMRDGELVDSRGQSRGARVADGILSMEEARAYNHRLLKRQHFGREPPSTPKLF